MLDKFNFTRNDDGSFTVESKISGNKCTVEIPVGTGNSSMHSLLYTLLCDLEDEGLFG